MEKINHKISTPYIHAAYPRGLNEVRENPRPKSSRSTTSQCVVGCEDEDGRERKAKSSPMSSIVKVNTDWAAIETNTTRHPRSRRSCKL
jgi:hypothetical protein